MKYLVLFQIASVIGVAALLFNMDTASSPLPAVEVPDEPIDYQLSERVRLQNAQARHYESEQMLRESVDRVATITNKSIPQSMPRQ